MARILKYNEAKQQLIQYVAANGLRAGDKLPSEQKLCTLFGVSNLPLRRAIDELRHTGALRKVENSGVYVGDGWRVDSHASTLGLLSVAVHDFPNTWEERRFKQALAARRCALRVWRTDETLQPDLVAEMARCDYLIVSGFLTPVWLEAIKALERPVLQLGRPGLETGLPRIEYDFRQAYRLMLESARALGCARVLAWLPSAREHSNAHAYAEGFADALQDAGFAGDEVAIDTPSVHSIDDAVASLVRHRDRFDILLLRDYNLATMALCRDWGRLLGGRPVMTLASRVRLPRDYDRQPGLYRVVFPQSQLEAAEEFFWVRMGRWPAGQTAVRLTATLAHNFSGVRADAGRGVGAGAGGD